MKVNAHYKIIIGIIYHSLNTNVKYPGLALIRIEMFVIIDSTNQVHITLHGAQNSF